MSVQLIPPETKTRRKFTPQQKQCLASKRVEVHHQELPKIDSGHDLGTTNAEEAQMQLEDMPAIH